MKQSPYTIVDIVMRVYPTFISIPSVCNGAKESKSFFRRFVIYVQTYTLGQINDNLCFQLHAKKK